MYYSHFGLDQAPFKITPNTEFFFSGGNRGPILEALIYAITHGEGIVKVTGEVGSGKTMLCNMLQSRLPEHIETVYLANPSVSADEILHAIAFELQLGLDRGASRLQVMHALQEYLLKRFAEGKRVVTFVEESQGMPLETLEEIRLLSNLETQHDKLLQIVLFGQPELDANLREPRIRQLRERITHSFRLDPLGTEEIREYLMFRMRAAGYRGPDLFSHAVVKAIARASAGLTRRVNIIADKALLGAFSENTHTIKPKHVAAAVRDSEFARDMETPAARSPWAWAGAAVIAAVAAGAALYFTDHAAVAPASRALAPATQGGTQTASEVPAAVQPSPEPAQPAPSPAQPAPTPAQPASAPAQPASAAARPGQIPAQPTVANSTPASPRSAAQAEPNNVVKTVSSTPAAGVSAAPAPTGASAPAAATPAPAAAPTAPAASGDVLEQRLAATLDWVGRAPGETYSIQLLGTNDEGQLRHYLKDIGKFIEITDIFVYRTLAKQRPSLTVLYGSFDDRRAASAALEKLPGFMRAQRPLLRTVGGIRTELEQVKGS